MTREIQLINSTKITLVDDGDYERLVQSGFRWYLLPNNGIDYVYGYGPETTCALHRFILNAKSGELVDHKDRDGLNNQRSNLRIANRTQNQANRKINCNNKSGYKGVYFCTYNFRYRAQIRYNGKNIRLGRYRTAEEAALAYDKAAKKYFGEFARLNFPEGKDQ